MKFLKTPYIIIVLSVFAFLNGNSQTLEAKLYDLKNKYNFTLEKLETNSFFDEKYLLDFEQPVDHNNPNGPTFLQRVYISHFSFDNPVVFITEGYAANYAAQSIYVNELSLILEANQICVEHRYFGESSPENIEWEYLTTFQAASDHHRVIELLKEIYSGPYVNTGISKGGQTAMFHRYYYPEDVDVTVGYVCPLNFSVEDQRVYQFLREVGDSATRQRIFNFQLELLKNKSIYIPHFEELAEKKNLTYPMGILEGYELTVLEYSFAFWQWGTIPADSIPSALAEPHKMIDHLNKVSGIDWVSNEGLERIRPFFLSGPH